MTLRSGTFSRDYAPPWPWSTFYVRFNRKDQKAGKASATCTVDRLTDDELAWVSRVVEAEQERRVP